MIKTEIKDSILYVTLNRPEVRNAFNAELVSKIHSVFNNEASSEEVRAVVLSGEGASFSAGADLNWMKSFVGASIDDNQKDSLKLFEMFESIYDCPVPTIAKVHGHAMGGGVGLVSACDIVACEQNTKFAFSEVRLGIVPSVISTFVLGKAKISDAKRYMITGEVFRGSEAVDLGISHFSGSQKDVEQFVDSTIKSILASGPNAVRKAKKLVHEVLSGDWNSNKEFTIKLIAEQRVSPEGQEGLKAFLEKRKPDWVK